MSRPYGYAGRPAGTPAMRLTPRARHLIDGATLLGCAAACWLATLALPSVVHATHPTTPVQAPASAVVHDTGETR